MTTTRDELTIDDLCAETGFTRRTIRYYLQRGLIPPPEGGGRRRIYRRDHLLRLLLVRALQERRYPLEEIRARLADLKLPDLGEMLASLESTPHAEPPPRAVGAARVAAAEGDSERPLPLPPPEMRELIVVPVTDGVDLVARAPQCDEEKALLLEAARRAAEPLRGRPVEWLPHPDPTIDAHLKRIQRHGGTP